MKIEKIEEFLKERGYQSKDFQVERKGRYIRVLLSLGSKTWTLEMPKDTTEEKFISRLGELIEFYKADSCHLNTLPR